MGNIFRFHHVPEESGNKENAREKKREEPKEGVAGDLLTGALGGRSVLGEGRSYRPSSEDSYLRLPDAGRSGRCTDGRKVLPSEDTVRRVNSKEILSGSSGGGGDGESVLWVAEGGGGEGDPALAVHGHSDTPLNTRIHSLSDGPHYQLPQALSQGDGLRLDWRPSVPNASLQRTKEHENFYNNECEIRSTESSKNSEEEKEVRVGCTTKTEEEIEVPSLGRLKMYRKAWCLEERPIIGGLVFTSHISPRKSNRKRKAVLPILRPPPSKKNGFKHTTPSGARKARDSLTTASITLL